MLNKSLLNSTFILLLFCSLLSCDKENVDNFPLKQADLLDQETYDVYSSALDEYYSSKRIIVDQETITTRRFDTEGDVYKHLLNTFPNFDTTIVNFHLENGTKSALLGNNFTTISSQVILISREESDYYLAYEPKSYSIENLFNKYKADSQVIRLSQVGFNEAKNQAIFEMQSHVDHLTSMGFYLYLEKVDGKWEVLAFGLTYVG